ncbi:nuclear-interacting partner of ALK [Xyrichtys novacula]|uniref:Nuclear-interacting partner of ALK n=1 Tax=Xyrichtys novacula TaxID=13765 RepID=A0AAV1F102_XYRNO|nr:nuclear-interacting partner of ALK [Xyrichtys novacula]
MATLGGSRGDRLGNSNHQKSTMVSPEKVRELLNEGVSPTAVGSNSKQGNANVVDGKNNSQATPLCEGTNKQAFFSRVESYSCLKWAGKPRTLSPLVCARYGWINVGCDMLKCSSCQAFLCASLQPTLDFEKYESRIAEILGQLQTQHEKFCPWPDFPCPERFWLVPDCEPPALLTAFLERFQSACLLAQQLPAMKPEQLKSMALTEDVVSVILQLIEEEQKRKGLTLCTEPLAVQVAACIVSLCGWAASPSLKAMNLPILTCSYCMRKVGLWNFYQMEGLGAGGDDNGANNTGGPSAQTAVAASAATHEGAAEQPTSASSTPVTTPCRMKLRSQDTTRSDQGEGTSSPVGLRARSRDSPSPSEEIPSPLTRGKRPATRNKGQGDSAGAEGVPSLQNPPKRLCLSSVGAPDGLLHKNAFDPLAQHRDWCPWVSVGKENVDLGTMPFLDGGLYQQGWKAALDLLVPMKKNSNLTGESLAQGPRDKSKRVFAIFRQWQVSSSPSQ